MNKLKRSLAFHLLRMIIKPGNLTVIDGGRFLVPPRRNSYQLQGYRISEGQWQQHMLVLPIDPDKEVQPNSVSTVGSIMRLMGFKVESIMLKYAPNRGNMPVRTHYEVSER